jgi:hypothetical protein
MGAPVTRWAIEPTVHCDRKNIFAFAGEHGAYHVGTLVSGSKSKLDRFEAAARLIAAAHDHALVCWAMCVQDATWEEWTPFDGSGEFCFAGLRYATRLDEFGCPRLTDALRANISASRAASAEQSESAQ